jgi:predicted metal-dependent peptidase
VPLGLQRWANELLEPKADWRSELAALVRGSIASVRGNDNLTYHRESRRNPNLGFILPANIGQKVNITVVVDTSGSMCDKELTQALTEIDAILKDLPWCDNLVVLACDAATHAAKTIRRADDVILKGGGGTDMRIGIADALAIYPKPDVIVVITDGWTPWPEKEPNAKIVAALTQKPTDHSLPLYAKMVMVEPDPDKKSR